MTEVQQFRKKPVVIEAVQLTDDVNDDDAREIAAWCGGSYNSDGDGGIDIETLEGVMHASDYDWIIKGVQGEFYPCKPDIFAATYDEVEATLTPLDAYMAGYHDRDADLGVIPGMWVRVRPLPDVREEIHGRAGRVTGYSSWKPGKVIVRGIDGDHETHFWPSELEPLPSIDEAPECAIRGPVKVTLSAADDNPAVTVMRVDCDPTALVRVDWRNTDAVTWADIAADVAASNVEWTDEQEQTEPDHDERT